MQHSRAVERPARPNRERMDYHTQQQRRRMAPAGKQWHRTDKREQHTQYASM